MKERTMKLDRTDDDLVRDEIDARVVELEAARILNTTWLHVDMDGKYKRRSFKTNTKFFWIKIFYYFRC